MSMHYELMPIALLMTVGVSACENTTDPTPTASATDFDARRLVAAALSEANLAHIHRTARMIGTGGPSVVLPSGERVTRDTVASAIQPIVQQGDVCIPALVDALKDPNVHMRYGAYLALRKLVQDPAPYFPLLSPVDPSNTEAWAKWKKLAMERDKTRSVSPLLKKQHVSSQPPTTDEEHHTVAHPEDDTKVLAALAKPVTLREADVPVAGLLRQAAEDMNVAIALASSFAISEEQESWFD